MPSRKKKQKRAGKGSSAKPKRRKPMPPKKKSGPHFAFPKQDSYTKDYVNAVLAGGNLGLPEDAPDSLSWEDVQKCVKDLGGTCNQM